MIPGILIVPIITSIPLGFNFKNKNSKNGGKDIIFINCRNCIFIWSVLCFANGIIIFSFVIETILTYFTKQKPTH